MRRLGPLLSLTGLLASTLVPWPVQAATTLSPAAAASGAPSVAASQPADLVQARIDNQTAQAAYYRAQVAKSAAPETPAWLQTVLGAVLAIVGGAFSAWLTNRIADRKRRQEAHGTYVRQKGQLRLSAQELLAALEKIPPLPAPPPAFLSESLVYAKPTRPGTADRSDPYYLKYDLVDTVYRFCALLGWLELYRSDSSFMRGPDAEKSQIEGLFAAIRSSLSAVLDDELRKDQKGKDESAKDEKGEDEKGAPRSDGFVLEDDQRAIGEQMLSRRRLDASASVIGYAAFCEQLFRDPDRANPTSGAHPTSQNWWVWNATRFFTDMGESLPGTDLRRVRLVQLTGHLGKLLAALQ